MIQLVDEETMHYLANNKLVSAFAWVQDNAWKHFGKQTQMELEFCRECEEGEGDALSLRILAKPMFPAKEFREQRKAFLESMTQAGFKEMHDAIAVFQLSGERK